jgi:Arc/MetJ-type ribon-helix-helix transcriptional regulator
MEVYMTTLKRTQMYFPEEMLTELRLVASAKKESLSEVVREAVSSFLKQKNTRSPNWDSDPLWEMVGSGNSGLSDGSLNHDFYLYGKTK